MALTGVIPPPPGITPNFVNPEQNGREIYVLGILGVICSTVFLLMRIYTKLRINRSFASEDVFVILAWICSLATVLTIIITFKFKGEGIHLWDVTTAQFSNYQKLVLSASVVYLGCLGFAKISILLVFRRISNDRSMQLAIHCIMTIIGGYSIALAICLIFPCRPVAMAWDASITKGSCINRPALYVTTAVANIVSDLAILILPIPTVIKLKIPLQQKIGLAGMFAVGSLTFITSIIRLITLQPLFTNPDQTWVVAIPAVWIIVEANLVIICCCFLALKSFLRHHAPTLIGEKTNSYKVNSAYEDRHPHHRSGGGGGGGALVITKNVDFNLSWQDDSRVRIHEYGPGGEPAHGVGGGSAMGLEMENMGSEERVASADGRAGSGNGIGSAGMGNGRGGRVEVKGVAPVAPMSPV